LPSNPQTIHIALRGRGVNIKTKAASPGAKGRRPAKGNGLYGERGKEVRASFSHAIVYYGGARKKVSNREKDRNYRQISNFDVFFFPPLSNLFLLYHSNVSECNIFLKIFFLRGE
jgi:hypothetical protein